MRQFLFTGFNGFGQFGGGMDVGRSKITAFKVATETVDVDDDDNDNNGEVVNGQLIVAPSWRYTAFALGKLLWLRGLLSNAPNEQTRKVQASAKIIQMAVSDKYCLVLLENGKIFKVLPKLQLVLHEVKLEAHSPALLPQKRTFFGKPVKEENIIITHIACGTHVAVVVSSTNGVYSLPSLIYQLPRHMRVKQLVCGYEHTLILNSNGDIYSWGNGLRGQLGHPILRLEEIPTLLDALAGVKIISIAAGGWHSAAVSAFGDLYLWGLNTNGQLGLRVYKLFNEVSVREPTVYPLPEAVDLPACCVVEKSDKQTEKQIISCVPIEVFAGARHTLLQMNCGRIWVTGWNAHGQLGLDDERVYYDSFQILFTPNYKNIVCGPWCTILYT